MSVALVLGRVRQGDCEFKARMEGRKGEGGRKEETGEKKEGKKPRRGEEGGSEEALEGHKMN